MRVYLSEAAKRALSLRDVPLYVELQLYFSCMTRKRVRFHQLEKGNYTPVSDKLKLMFRTIMTQRCSIHGLDGPPPVTDFPIVRAERFVPRWVCIDHDDKRGWQGFFGYTLMPA